MAHQLAKVRSGAIRRAAHRVRQNHRKMQNHQIKRQKQAASHRAFRYRRLTRAMRTVTRPNRTGAVFS